MLFADLTGFTTFSEGRDAEDVRAMLSGYFEAARRIVDAYGGLIEKFIGDAVMALWGAPVAREDDSERAVRAALDLVAEVAEYGRRLGVELLLRAGVLTGQAAVELEPSGEGKVIGDTVNTASRLQSIAEPGVVLVDDLTRSVTDQAILYHDAGRHTVKGRREPVHAWRAMRVIAGRAGARRPDLELPLIGRRDELASLKHAIDVLVESGSGLRLVSVVGEAGLGKSRLAWELEKYADGLAATVLWHHGRARGFGQDGGFAPLADVVRSRAKINFADTSDAQEQKLATLVDGLVPSQKGDERRRIARALYPLLGLDADAEPLDRGELFSAWRLLIQHLATRAPVALLFEDLHWADQGLCDFIAYLCQWVSASPVLVLVFSRPEQRIDSLALLGERIDLAPLTDDEIERLVEEAVTDAPASLTASVRDHAGGNPLFAVESLRMLANQGVMVAETSAQRYRLVGEVEELEVPPSIQALVAARLDGLGVFERRVLVNGAILGRQFGVEGASALAQISHGDARSLLAGLVRKQFLSIDLDPRSPSPGSYEFVHVVVQRIALATLSRSERKAMHLRAYEWLAGRAADPNVSAQLAWHITAAFELLPDDDDAPTLRARALELTLNAARRADNVGALSQAIVLFERASRLDVDEMRRARHFIRAARCAERAGDREALAADHYATARHLYEAAGRRRDALRLRARELYVYRWRRPSSALIPPLREVYQALSDSRDAAFAETAAYLAGLLYADGAAESAEKVAAEAAVTAESVNAYEALGLAQSWRACALIELARPVDALEYFQASLETRARHTPSEVPHSLVDIAVTLAALGRFQEAIEAAHNAIEAADRVASRVNHNLGTLHLARALFSVGQWDESLSIIDEVAPTVLPANRGMLIGPPALMALYRGDEDRARAMIEDFDRRDDVDAAFESDYRAVRATVLSHLEDDEVRACAIIAGARSGDFAEWPAWLPLAVDVISGHAPCQSLRSAVAALSAPSAPKTSPIVVAQLERLSALAAISDGEPGTASQHWNRAIEVAAESGSVFELAVLKLELIEHIPSWTHAEADLKQVIATFDRLGARPWIARARSAARAYPTQYERPAAVK